ncbi:hypothetical protein OUZ56_018603 [Daphnia magna]|uniref:Uncharacterized protein n=1 Tax=Daphnia magna TaxID=35525 RepID=A0ABQ9Z9D4_9CRUS|nr:hypothetical protein OUZ56_018603 [Daphnia magna]
MERWRLPCHKLLFVLVFQFEPTRQVRGTLQETLYLKLGCLEYDIALRIMVQMENTMLVINLSQNYLQGQ